jgi:undecaprenyl-diphosphatase
LLRYVSRHDFTAFAWYRIVFGVVILGTALTGLVRWSS